MKIPETKVTLRVNTLRSVEKVLEHNITQNFVKMLDKKCAFMHSLLFTFCCFLVFFFLLTFAPFKNNHLDISVESIISHLFDVSEHFETLNYINCSHARETIQMLMYA